MAGTNRSGKLIATFTGSHSGEASPATLPMREVLDIRQAAEYLGISPDSLYKYAAESFIPAFKLGNRWRFKRSLLEDWMEQQSTVSAGASHDKDASPRQKKPAARVR